MDECRSGHLAVNGTVPPALLIHPATSITILQSSVTKPNVSRDVSSTVYAAMRIEWADMRIERADMVGNGH